MTCALALRVAALSSYGFSEDEAAKVAAINAYRHGDFSANAEHPMLMKLAMWGSLELAERWNQLAPASGAIAPETALRLPNAVAGALTVIAVYGAVELLFSPAAAAAAALLVALDPNVIAINRLGKEDSLLMLCFFIAVGCYERGKRLGGVDLVRAERWYVLSGAAFGLMLASKYMPHFFGLYALFNVIADPAPGDNKPPKRRYYGAMAAAFIATNFIILAPATWAYVLQYVGGERLAHHGSFYRHQLYVISSVASFDGLPPTYYLRLIATKVPLPVLIAALAGIVPLVRRRQQRGFIWLRVMLVPLLISYSLMAAKFQRYALPMLLFIDILAAVAIWLAARWVWRQRWPAPARAAVCLGVCASIVTTLIVTDRRLAPFYSSAQNAIGARLERPVEGYPEEAYDFGVREAVSQISAAAGADPVIISDATGVVGYYVANAPRSDVMVASLSRRGLTPPGDRWVLVQNDHVYFENIRMIEQLRRDYRPWREFRIGGTVVLQVFHLGR